MNNTSFLKLPLLIGLTACLCACGQSGKLFLPGHGTGYYRDHPFTHRPVVAAPKKK